MPNHYFASDTSSCRTCILRFGTTQTSLFSLLMLLVLSTTVTKCILHLRAQPLIFICVHANTHLHPHLHLCVHILSSSMHLHVCARQHSPSSSSSLVCAHPLIFNASSFVCTPTLTFILIFTCVCTSSHLQCIFICVHANTHLHPHLHLCVHILSSSMHLHLCARQNSPSSSSSLVCAHPLTFILIFRNVRALSERESSVQLCGDGCIPCGCRGAREGVGLRHGRGKPHGCADSILSFKLTVSNRWRMPLLMYARAGAAQCVGVLSHWVDTTSSRAESARTKITCESNLCLGFLKFYLAFVCGSCCEVGRWLVIFERSPLRRPAVAHTTTHLLCTKASRIALAWLAEPVSQLHSPASVFLAHGALCVAGSGHWRVLVSTHHV
jgi:hypothetical protein